MKLPEFNDSTQMEIYVTSDTFPANSNIFPVCLSK